jgi:drug/metabolite transporter (DMT)-like permease
MRSEWRMLAQAPLSLAIMGVAFTLYTFALVLTNPFNTILLFYLTPAWSILLGKALYGDRIGIVRALVVICGFAGIALVLGATSLPIPRNLGDWVALSSGALWALGTSLSSRENGPHSWARLMQFSIAGMVSTWLMALALSGLAPKVIATSAHANTFLLAIVVGFALFALPNVLVIWATSRLSSARVGVLLMMEVVIGTMAISLLSSQSLAPLQIAGAVLIVAAGIVEVMSRDTDTHAIDSRNAIASPRT